MRRVPKWAWYAGGGALALMLLRSSGGGTRDIDALTRMLITETGFNKSAEEMAQIVFVAVNRARNRGEPLWYVVDPDKPTQIWNNGSIYAQRFNAARNSSSWEAAREFVLSVLSGTSGYRNSGVTSFVHPGSTNFNMPCYPNRSVPVSSSGDPLWSSASVPGYGTRCIPKWAQGGIVRGTALFA